VVPTFIIDWPFLIFLGFLFGYAVKGIPSVSLYQTRAFWSGIAVVLFFSSLAYYTYLKEPDWMFMYFVRSSDVPHWIVYSLFAGYLLAYNLGFFMKVELAKICKKTTVAVMVLFLALSGLIILPVKERYLNVGMLDAFLSGQTVPLGDSVVGKAGMFMPVMLALAVGLFIWSRRQRFS